MKTLFFLITAAIAISACTNHTHHDSEAPTDGVFIHISHGIDDPHRLLMGLNMAYMMAGDHNVLVYVDVEGINAVLNDSPDISYAHFPTLHEQLQQLPARGVTLMACPGCLRAAGKSEADLAEGVQTADKQLFFTFTNGRIITFNY